MTNHADAALILAGTGKTGSRVAQALRDLGSPVRTAARSRADVRFDWDDASTHLPALVGIDRVYLVPPAASVDFAPAVIAFLDLVERAGVRHVTFLSAHGIEQAPPEVALRAVELDLIGRSGMGHTFLRPAWFMQNFSESFFLPTVLQGIIPAPTADGAEAFVSANDIAAVAAQTLAAPGDHANAEYAPTGPAALTMAEVATIIGQAAGRTVEHVDVPRNAWVQQSVDAGVPAPYAQMLGGLFDTIAAGNGATPTADVERVTGRLATRFEDYAAGAATSWTQVSS